MINWTLGESTSLSRIVLGSDNNLWAIEAGAGRVIRESLRGAYAPVALESGEESFARTINSDIAAGDDGNIWVSQRDRPTVGKLVPDEDGEGVNYTRYKVAGGPTTFLSPGPAHDIWFADQAGMIGSISSPGANGEPACATKVCAAPITALARGPEGKIWFAAGGTVARFEPPRLCASPSGRLLAKGRSKATTRLACSGGAAGQHCQGKLEMRPAKGSGRNLGSVRFDLVTGTNRKVTLNLTRAAAAELARDRRLAVRLVARTGGKVSAKHIAVLRAAE